MTSVTKIKSPVNFNISATNFSDNYFKFHNHTRTDGIIIDPVLTPYMDMDALGSSRTLQTKSEMNTVVAHLFSGTPSDNIATSSNFNSIDFKFKYNGENITTNVNPVSYNIKVNAIEKVIKSIKETIDKTRFTTPLQSIIGIVIIFLSAILITRLFHLDFLDGIFGKVLENKVIGIDNIFKRMFLIFYLFIIANLGFIVINFLWGYSDFLLSLGTSGKDNDAIFILVGFLMSIIFLGPTYIWAYMATNRFTRYVIIYGILAIHLLLIDWLSIPTVFNKRLTYTNKEVENKASIISQILLFLLVIFVIIYALYFKFHNKEIFASGYKNKMMYIIFFALLVCISGYSSFIKNAYCSNSTDIGTFCQLLSTGKISLISLGSLIAIVTWILGTLTYKYIFKKPLPNIEADSTNYFFVKTK